MNKSDAAAHYLPYGPPQLTRAGLRAGVNWFWPFFPGSIVFGLTAGALAAKTGLSLIHTVLLSALVYAGAAQLAVLSIWPNTWTPSDLIAAALIVLTINSRYILQGASLYPYFCHLPARTSYGLLFINVDLTWLLFVRHASEARENNERPDLGRFVGLALVMWLNWTVCTVPGWYVGNAIGDFKRYGLDLFIIVFFASLIVPMWKGFRHAVPWAAAAVFALLAQRLLPGSYYMLVGALAGACAGAVCKW